MSNFKDFDAHFQQKISKSLVNYVTDKVLKDSRYLFFKTVLGIQYAHCTHCNKRHRSEIKLQHKQSDRVMCPHCKSSCEVRAAGMSRKYMVDKAVIVWYEKSVLNSQAITARIMEVRREYAESYENVETTYNCSHMYVFEPGRSEHWHYRGKCASSYSGFDKSYGSGSYKRFVSQTNIRRVVKGTPFQYSTWEQYTRFDNSRYVSDMVEFFDLAARYPCVEYLTKLGFSKIIRKRLHGHSTKNAINWRGKTINKVLRLDKNDIKDVRSCGLEYGPDELLYLQRIRRQGKTHGAWEAYHLSKLEANNSNIYSMTGEFATKEEVQAYLLKQFRRDHWESITTTASDYYDYLRQCRELGMDIAERRYMFPNDLDAAHDKLTARISYKKNKTLELKLKKRISSLDDHYMESDKFIIRPIRSIEELFREGKRLNHCVGGYADRYATGETNIYAVRLKSRPNDPYYTLQMNGAKFVQCRGKKNCDMTMELRKTVDLFAKTVESIGKRKKTRVKASPNRQEAIVV